jgi:hypothetical protein
MRSSAVLRSSGDLGGLPRERVFSIKINIATKKHLASLFVVATINADKEGPGSGGTRPGPITNRLSPECDLVTPF